MNGFLNWVGNILFFLVFVTVIENLLPGKHYSRYVRLSAGMVLILLVMKPVTGGLQLEDRIRQWFETFAFQQEAQDLSRDILGMERQRLARVMDGYEQMVEEDVSAMAAELGIRAVSAQVTIERNEESENYGAVTHIRMEVEWEHEEDRKKETEHEEDDRALQAVNPVKPVDQVAVKLDRPDGGENDEAETETYDQAEQLRRKVERCYGLETREVEIQFKGR